MLAPLAYYFFVLPLSYLPMRLLYILSDGLQWIIKDVIRYRKNVVQENLNKAFPEKSAQERKQIQNEFYKHFADLLLESIKNITASQKFLESRIKVENPELIEKFAKHNQSVLLVSGHYNNWEYMITAQNFLFAPRAVGIGQPLSSKFWDQKLNKRRARFGMRIINARNVKEKMNAWQHECLATLVLADQSPGDSYKSYWMNFLGHPTAVLFGPEKLARDLDQPVLFFTLDKYKRGRYSLYLEEITVQPQQETYGFITEQHTKKLEQKIKENPAYWIWSHKRWKREIPENLEKLKQKQKEDFDRQKTVSTLSK